MWKTISSKEIFCHPRLSLIEDEIILPSGAKTTYLRYKDDGSAAATIFSWLKFHDNTINYMMERYNNEILSLKEQINQDRK